MATDSSVPQSNEGKEGSSITSKCALAFLALLVAGGVATGGYYLKQQPMHESQGQSMIGDDGEGCQPTIKELHNPILEITLATVHSEQMIDETETKNLEHAVLAAYNQASGGCSDKFQRWMYGVNTIDQTVLEHVALDNEADTQSISHTFEKEFNVVLRLETLISCDGCSQDEAFASVYPSSFGKRASNRRQLQDSSITADTVYSDIEETFKISKMTLTTESDIDYTTYYQENVSIKVDSPPEKEKQLLTNLINYCAIFFIK